MSRVLITGADGFVGQALWRRLLAAGHSVVPIVRVSDPAAVGVGSESGVSVAIGDIARFQDWPRLLQGVDAVIHLAARAHITKESLVEPLKEFRRVNVAGAVQLAGVAASAGVRRFVFLSSIGVNGNQDSGTPFTEADLPHPTEPYAVSKWEAEQALLEVAAGSQMQLTRIRPPLIVGPGAKGNLLRLMKLVASGLPLPLGAVRNARSFVVLEDLCDLLELCLSDSRAGGNLFLVADDEEISTADLLRAVAAGLGRSSRLWPAPVRLLQSVAAVGGFANELRRLTGSLRVDASLARNVLGWRPVVGLRRGIHEMTQSYGRSNRP